MWCTIRRFPGISKCLWIEQTVTWNAVCIPSDGATFLPYSTLIAHLEDVVRNMKLLYFIFDRLNWKWLIKVGSSVVSPLTKLHAWISNILHDVMNIRSVFILLRIKRQIKDSSKISKYYKLYRCPSIILGQENHESGNIRWLLRHQSTCQQFTQLRQSCWDWFPNFASYFTLT